MKNKEWINGNKMKFESGFKAFDKQTQVISTGNVVARTQLSGFVRPKSETECNGFVRDEGVLQKYDLEQGFLSSLLPYRLKGDVAKLADENGGCIAYLFFYKKASGQKEFIGLVITSKDYNHLKTFYLTNSNKHFAAVEEAKLYIINN